LRREGLYGVPDHFKRFVRESHKRGCAIIQDVFYNHLGPSDLDLWKFDGWRENEKGGIYFYNDDQSDIFRTRATKSSVNYVLSGSLDWAPGTHFQYNDGAPQLVSALIQNATGKTLAQYANERFFSKIGLTKYDWVVYTDGVTIGAFGLSMPPREFAKIAQCVCDSGEWHGEQVIPEDWVKQMLAVHAQDPTQKDNIGFGYFWWINKESKAVFMWGHGGQYAIIYPEKNIVVIVTAFEQLGGDFTFPKEELFKFTDRINNMAKYKMN